MADTSRIKALTSRAVCSFLNSAVDETIDNNYSTARKGVERALEILQDTSAYERELMRRAAIRKYFEGMEYMTTAQIMDVISTAKLPPDNDDEAIDRFVEMVFAYEGGSSDYVNYLDK